MKMNQLEDGKTLRLDYAKIAKIAAKCQDVIPVAVQDADTKAVLLIAYVNEQALKVSAATRTAVFWSTSRNELWEKGKTSGEVFDLLEIYVNCEQNSLLFQVRPRRGGICHTKNRCGEARSTCYYRKLNLKTWELENMEP
jgi:phosphoribosyl-AMP cyclohydrolase